jgi:hypothetical protein
VSNFRKSEREGVFLFSDQPMATAAAETGTDRLKAELIERIQSVPGPGSNSVYSLNVVGYVNKPLTEGQSVVANPLSPPPTAQTSSGKFFDSPVPQTSIPTASKEKRG